MTFGSDFGSDVHLLHRRNYNTFRDDKTPAKQIIFPPATALLCV